jgi:hypothetical protein
VQITAFAKTSGGIAHSVRKGAVVEAELVLAHFTEVAWLTHAPAHGIFDRAPAVKGTVVFAVLGATIVSDEWRRALCCAESIAYSIYLPWHISRTRDLGDVRHVHVFVCVVVPCLASMATDLLLRVFIVIARSARAACITAVFAIVTHVTLAEAVLAFAVVTAIVDAVMEIKIPHVVTNYSIPTVLDALGLPGRVR